MSPSEKAIGNEQTHTAAGRRSHEGIHVSDVLRLSISQSVNRNELLLHPPPNHHCPLTIEKPTITTLTSLRSTAHGPLPTRCSSNKGVLLVTSRLVSEAAAPVGAVEEAPPEVSSLNVSVDAVGNREVSEYEADEQECDCKAESRPEAAVEVLSASAVYEDGDNQENNRQPEVEAAEPPRITRFRVASLSPCCPPCRPASTLM
uniref:Uncharacterized protein n=1 Tax=Vitrella brassicaformis TaxID=1169539 RepID=A0A7S1P2I0_9ALVE|mmetsp:Transcript_227/g.566  ORF Transcript_227/g.566 Transcript_227/m.566 type:complete len:203 (+) Transcript_227:44-652(+)